jgi:hypothetical protein
MGAGIFRSFFMTAVSRRRFISSTALAVAATRLSAQSKSPVEVALRLDFGPGANGVVMTETFRAAALDSREVQTERSTSADRAKDGKVSLLVPHASAPLISVG